MGSVADKQHSAGVYDIFTRGGAMGAMMRSVAWSATPLGAPEDWPQSLRTSVSICLHSRFPILIWWGKELVMLYNDAYSSIIAAKHPRAMGAPGRAVFPEIWEVIGPMLTSVLRDGAATWSDDQLLLLDRNGYLEECYFTFSYSPIYGEGGGVDGVFTAVTETTARVLGERRLAALRELATSATEARTPAEACALAARALEGNRADLPFARIYLVAPPDLLADAPGGRLRLAGATAGDARGSDDTVGVASDAERAQAARVARTGEAEPLTDLPAPVTGRQDGERPPAEKPTAWALPIRQQEQRPVGTL
ncbi:MAG TPA: PAS domain-containing protein, partial [Ktedonobacterales bacterium]